jgi:magnesium transporter
MMDAFASVISNNLNIVMKYLTLVTIILSFPTMVFSFYGMNVDIPFQHSPHAFLITLLISVLLSALTTIIFWKRKFF